MIKIPGTEEGLPAIEELLSEGINVNVTLLFAVERYQAVADAWLRGLERRLGAGAPLNNVASVASFFISRIDTLVDQLLGHRIRPDGSSPFEPNPAELRGKVAIANAKARLCRLPAMAAGERWKTSSPPAPAPAAALGQHEHQGSGLQRRDVRRYPDRAGHRQHDAEGDGRRLCGTWQGDERASSAAFPKRATLKVAARPGIDLRRVTSSSRTRASRNSSNPSTGCSRVSTRRGRRSPATERYPSSSGSAVRSTTARSTKLECTPVTPSMRVSLFSSRAW